MRLVDLHCDTMDLLMGNDKKLYENDLCVDIKKLKKANSLAQTFALFVDTKDIKNPHDYCISMYERFLGELNKTSNSNNSSNATNKTTVEVTPKEKTEPIKIQSTNNPVFFQ